LSGLAPPASTVLHIRAARGRACGAPLTLETSASPAGLTARARPKARPEARGELTVATPQNAYKMRKSSHGDVMLPVSVHLPNVKRGCQKLKGQKRTEMKYCTQLWSDAKLAVVDGI
jgi:hypothetical protein